MKWTGRPPKFQDPDELEKKIGEYFEECNNEGNPYTVTGLALTLGISVQQLRDYKNCLDNINVLKQLDEDMKSQLSFIIKRAYQTCENYAESKMLDPKCSKSPIGYLFSLKNYNGDFVDKQEIETTERVIEVSLED